MTTYKLLILPKNRFRIVLCPVELRKLRVAWHQSRLLGTAAAREIPATNTRKRKSISKLERRAMVEDYVNKYRSSNGGKFPRPATVKKQVGGSYYTVRAIMQELCHNFNLSGLATASHSSTIGQPAQVNGTSYSEVISDCQVSDDSIAAVEEHGISAECDSSREEVLAKNICQKMVDMSNTIKNQETPAEYLSISDRKAVLEFVGECNKTSTCKEMNEDSKIMTSQDVLVISSLEENTPSNQTMTMDDSKLPAKPYHPSVVTDTSKKSEAGVVDQPSAKAFASDEVTRGPALQKTEDKTLQESSLWGNLKGFANNILNIWRKA